MKAIRHRQAGPHETGQRGPLAAHGLEGGPAIGQGQDVFGVL
ncbi:MAG: hypothetical protein P8129_14425 [Anaerolineae bacterium]